MTGTKEQLTEGVRGRLNGVLISCPQNRTGKYVVHPFPPCEEGLTRGKSREEEIAALAVYLASDASEYVQGGQFDINGGFFLVNP